MARVASPRPPLNAAPVRHALATAVLCLGAAWLNPSHAQTPGAALDASSAAALSRVEAWLRPGQAAAVLAKASAQDSFHLRPTAQLSTDAVGERHLRFDRRHQGVPVLGGDIIVHLSAAGQLQRVTTTLAQPLNLGVLPAVAKQQATELAEARFRSEGRADRRSAELTVVNLPSVSAQPLLAWVVKVRGARCGQPSEMLYMVDALTGEIRSQHENLRSLKAIECQAGADAASAASSARRKSAPARLGQGLEVNPEAAATGTGKSLYVGNVSIDTDKISDTSYEMRDTTRGSHFVADFAVSMSSPMVDADNTWGDNTNTDRASAAVDAAYGQRMTWDYFKALGRNGLANDGVGYSSTVHFEDVVGVGLDNAYWDGSSMKYGDGLTLFKPLVSLDIAGHEMSHGVTEHTANLVYAGESGGLNEATSDIFGAMVEYFANNAGDPPDYMIGEKVMKSGTGALRYMYKPSKDGPSHDCWYIGTAGLDPHYSSGIGNHFYYLLAEGSKPTGLPASPVCKDSDNSAASDTLKFSGIGRSKAEKLWYHALANNMTSGTTFLQAREATLNSAKSLHGDDSGEYRTVDYTWLAVNVAEVPKASSFTTNLSWQTAQILTPAPELVVMGRPGAAGKVHWYAMYLDAGKSVEVKLVAADATSNYHLVAYDTDHTKVLKSSKLAGGAKESITVQNTGTASKFIYITVPYAAGKAPYSMRVKLI